MLFSEHDGRKGVTKRRLYAMIKETEKGGIVVRETAERIASALKTDGLMLRAFETVVSTNTLCKAAAEEGAPEGTVILANAQHGGRGTRGRTFYSPENTGLYMSVLLRPRVKAQQALFVTTTAAVAVCRAIEQVAARRAQIKWVNDVYCDGKKVCGILTEAVPDLQTGGLRYAVLGIGLNVNDPAGGFPEELEGIAASVFGRHEGDRAALAAAVLDAFFERYPSLGAPEQIDEYRRLSLLDGRTVTVGERTAVVRGIDEACRLCVRYDDGTEAALLSGDVTLHREG